MALYQNFTTSSSGTITIPGPIIGTHTNNTIANIFTFSGNVGIGTTNPTQQLQLSQSLAVNNTTYLGNPTVGSARLNIRDISQQLIEFQFGTNTVGNITCFSSNPGIILNGGGGSSHLVLSSNGNIGLGTSTPAYRLDVNGVIKNNADIIIDSSSRLTIYNPTGGLQVRSGSSNMLHLNQDNNGNVSIAVGGGNVGIATTSPSYKLDVVGSIRSTDELFIGNGTGAEAITLWDSPGAAWKLSTAGWNLNIQNGTGGSTMNTRVTVTSTGNVGIANASPTYRLDVSGDIRGTGDWYWTPTKNYYLDATANNQEWSVDLRNQNSYTGCYWQVWSDKNSASILAVRGDTTNVGINNVSPSFKLDVNGDFRAYGGRYIIQNTQDGGTGRGIYMWQESDQNWAIYMGQSGAGRSFSGGTATTGVYGFAAHAVRFRVANNTANGWIFENSTEGHAASIRADGQLYAAGNLGLGVVSPGYRLHASGDIYADGGWLRVSGDRGLYFESHGRGIYPAINGDYGNVETFGEGKNNWEGYSIAGRYVFMSGDNNTCGIYNDLDNQWIMLFDRSDVNNKYATLYHNGAARLYTNSQGIYVSSRVIVDAGSGNAGYYFGENPGGGGSDAAWIKYYARSGEATTLEIGVSNDGDDNIYLNPSGNVGIGTNGPEAKLHVAGAAIFHGTPGSYQPWRATYTGGYASPASGAVVFGDGTGWRYQFRRATDNYILGYVIDWTDVAQIDFTGQHRADFTFNMNDIDKYVGYIVRSTGEYNNLNTNNKPMINEAIPIVDLTTQPNDKRVFGVISNQEDTGTERTYATGSFVTVAQKEETDNRLIINSVGEGGIWVCNINGNIENGDYITSCQIPGLGTKQESEFLANYTVAKATCDVNFSDLNYLKSKFDIRFLHIDGTIITEEEYNPSNSYIAAFIGCTYHCG